MCVEFSNVRTALYTSPPPRAPPNPSKEVRDCSAPCTRAQRSNAIALFGNRSVFVYFPRRNAHSPRQYRAGEGLRFSRRRATIKACSPVQSVMRVVEFWAGRPRAHVVRDIFVWFPLFTFGPSSPECVCRCHITKTSKTRIGSAPVTVHDFRIPHSSPFILIIIVPIYFFFQVFARNLFAVPCSTFAFCTFFFFNNNRFCFIIMWFEDV